MKIKHSGQKKKKDKKMKIMQIKKYKAKGIIILSYLWPFLINYIKVSVVSVGIQLRISMACDDGCIIGFCIQVSLNAKKPKII